MGRIQKLPIILGCSAAILTGSASYITGVDSQGIYIRMAAVMLIFFILGVYIRSTINSIKEDVLIRKIKEQQEEKERQKRQKEEEKAAVNAARFNPSGQPTEPERQNQDQLHQVDLTADNFEPLTVSRAIRTKVNG